MKRIEPIYIEFTDQKLILKMMKIRLTLDVLMQKEKTRKKLLKLTLLSAYKCELIDYFP